MKTYLLSFIALGIMIGAACQEKVDLMQVEIRSLRLYDSTLNVSEFELGSEELVEFCVSEALVTSVFEPSAAPGCGSPAPLLSGSSVRHVL